MITTTFKKAATVVVTAASIVTFSLSSPATATTTSNLLDNPGFELPENSPGMVQDSLFPGWQTTDGSNEFEVWQHNNGWETTGNKQYIELNANTAGAVYQDVSTTCDVLTWSLKHRGRYVNFTGPDVMHVLAGAAGGTGSNGLTVLQATTKNGSSITPTTEISDDVIVDETDDAANWTTWSGTYTVPSGQTTTRLAFDAVSGATGDATIGNFLDDISVIGSGSHCPVPLASTGFDAVPLTVGGTFAIIGGISAFVFTRRRTEDEN